MDGALARLYELALADSSTTEQSFLERMVSFYSGRSESFWRDTYLVVPRWMAYTTTVPDTRRLWCSRRDYGVIA